MRKDAGGAGAWARSRAAAGAAWGGEYHWPIVKVVDGDTIKVDARADFPPELAMLNVRLRGVDTPEICPARTLKKSGKRRLLEASTNGLQKLVSRMLKEKVRQKECVMS